jgi:hypothetical protein
LNYATHSSVHSHGASRRALLCATAVLLAGGAHAAQSRTQMGVSATVLPMARMQVTSAPADIQISADDLRRGYIDVRQPTALVVNSNSPDGFALELMTLSPMVSALIVNGMESDQILGAEGGTLIQRWQRPQAMRVMLRFRLLLAPGLNVGRYGWPVKLGVRPL